MGRGINENKKSNEENKEKKQRGISEEQTARSSDGYAFEMRDDARIVAEKRSPKVNDALGNLVKVALLVVANLFQKT